MSSTNWIDKYRQHVKFTRESGQEAQCLCPFHDDKVASMSVNKSTGQWYCFSCGEGGGFKTFLKKKGVVDDSKVEHLVPEDEIKQMHKSLMSHEKALKYLSKKRGISRKTVEEYELGYDGMRIWIPVKDDDGAYVNVRKYRPRATKGKVIGYASGFNRCRIFPARATVDDDVYVMEGEMDTLCARSLGLPAYTQTAGALTWDARFNYYFTDKNVYVCFDNDEQGRDGARQVANALAKTANRVHIVDLPVEKEKEDFTDFITQYGKTLGDFKKLCESTPPAVSKDTLSDDVHTIDLFRASDSKYFKKLVKLKVMVIGKERDPYIIPKRINLTCSPTAKKCKSCVLAAGGGSSEVVFDRTDPEILETLDTTKIAIKRLAAEKIGASCLSFELDVQETFNVEALTVINDVDYITDKSDYVTTTVYFTGHGVRTNANYELTGRIYPEPKTQLATVLVHEAVPSKRNVEMFEMENGVLEDLQLFEVKGSEKECREEESQ